MIELKCKGSVEYAEKIEIQARETFGDCGILIGRDGDKVTSYTITTKEKLKNGRYY